MEYPGVRILALMLFLPVSAALAENPAMIDTSWVNEPVSSGFSKFHSTAIHPCPSDKSILAVYCEMEEDWRGHMRVFKQSGDRVEWAAIFPDKYLKERGAYVVSTRWTSLPMLEHPVLELMDSTHMGNGTLWLFELDGRELRLILQTPVMGRCWSEEPEFGIPPHGEARFEGERLKVEYFETSGKEKVVKLSGTLAITDMQGNEKPSCGYEQLCVWNGDKRLFEARRPGRVDGR